MNKTLEGILDSITRAETRAVNFFFESDFATKHPVVSSAAFGAVVSGIISAEAYSSVTNPSNLIAPHILIPYILAPGVGVAVVIASFLRPRNTVHKYGLDTKLFDDFDRYSFDIPVAEKFPRSLVDRILTHPRSVAASLSAVLFAYFYAGGSSNSVVSMAATSIVLYFPYRYLMYGLKFFAHSTSNKWLDFTLGEFAELLDNKLRTKFMHSFATRRMEEAVQKNPNSSLMRAKLAGYYLTSGRTLEGMLELKRSIDESEYVPNKLVGAGIDMISSTSESLNALSRGTAQPSDYIGLIRVLSVVGETEHAMHFFDEYESKFPGVHNDINRALLLQNINQKEQAHFFWRRALDGIYSQESLRILPTGEGVHFSGRFDVDEMLASTLFVKRETPKEADYESRLIANVASLNRSPAYIMPQVVGSVPYGSYVDLVLRYIKGVTLAGMEHDVAAYGKTIDSLVFTSWFHRNISPDFSEVGRVDLQRKFSQIVGRLGFNGSSASFLEAVGSVVADLEANDLWVLAKDGHPYQFIVGSDSIAPVDYDDKGVDLLSRDVAKALVHPDLPLSKDRLPQLVSDTARVYHDEGMVDDMQRQELLFLKGMLLQPLSYCDAWSAPELVKMRGRRAAAIERAFVALDVLRQNHRSDFSVNSVNYTRISDGYRRLEELLKAHAS